MEFEIRCAYGGLNLEYLDKLRSNGYHLYECKSKDDELNWIISIENGFDIVSVSEILKQDLVIITQSKYLSTKYHRILIYDDYIE